MTKHARWAQATSQARDLNGREIGGREIGGRELSGRDRAARAQLQAVRHRDRHPLARWRMAVTVIVEPLILLIVPLLIWGMIARAQMPLLIGIGLTIGLILLVLATLVASALAVDARRWQRDEAR